ncbi:hypothetical protein YC2023_088907 [Brassica napus]
MDKTHLDPNTNLLTEEYTEGIGEVMRLVQQQPEANTLYNKIYRKRPHIHFNQQKHCMLHSGSDNQYISSLKTLCQGVTTTLKKILVITESISLHETCNELRKEGHRER